MVAFSRRRFKLTSWSSPRACEILSISETVKTCVPWPIRWLTRVPARAARAYGNFKKKLADECGDDIDTYIDGMTNFILEILAKTDLSPKELELIEPANQKA